MKKANTFMRYFLYFFLVCVGIIIGMAIRHFYNVPLAKTIDIVDLATLVVTIFLAVYIPEVLDRKIQSRRDKKDLIEKRIDEFQILLKKVNMLVQDDDAMSGKGFRTVQNSLDVSEHKFEIISRLLDVSNIGSFDADVEAITVLVKEHKKLLEADKPNGERFSYPDDVQKKEESLFNRIDEAASHLVFKISDAE